MTPIKIALVAIATLVSVQSIAQAAPLHDKGSRYVETGMGTVETGIDQAKGYIR
ncbi:hypothetical protein [Rhodoplanes azumiensis]|uniref:Uncharacterized protein n=1 Tax=Rhodoplanes azumiensis TaxID=1897628 RepID=A0ABW5ALY8_9BRAD